MSWTGCQYYETSVLLSLQSDLSLMGGQVEADSRALPKHPPPSFNPVPQHAIHCCRQCLTRCSKRMWAGVPKALSPLPRRTVSWISTFCSQQDLHLPRVSGMSSRGAGNRAGQCRAWGNWKRLELGLRDGWLSAGHGSG